MSDLCGLRWCGHCKALAPEYEVAATAFKSLPVKIASVDADAHRDLGQKFGVTGQPKAYTHLATAD